MQLRTGVPLLDKGMTSANVAGILPLSHFWMVLFGLTACQPSL